MGLAWDFCRGRQVVMKKSNVIWSVLYVVCMAGMLWGMFRAREAAFATYGTQQAIEEWEAWREDVRQLPPNQRDVPESDLPPAYVLMRDNFGVLVGFAVILVSALFFITMVVSRGAVQKTVIRED